MDSGWRKRGSGGYINAQAKVDTALDEILAQPYQNVIDSVEFKLLGLGSEGYVVGSHEFYLGYVIS